MVVRDGDPSIDVIALQLCEDGRIRTISKDTQMVVPTDRPPSREEALVIARQKLRLPSYFGKKWTIKDVIQQLEKETQTYFSEWRYASLLKEELALLFDDTLHTVIGEAEVWYDMENGFSYGKETERKDGR